MKKTGSSLVSSFIVLTLIAGFLLYSAIVSAQVFEPPKCAPPACQPASVIGGLSDVLRKRADARGFRGIVTIGGEEGTENVKVGIGVIAPSSALHVFRGGFATSARTNDLAHFGFENNISGNRQLLIQQWGNSGTAKQFIMGNGFISDAGPSIVNGLSTRAAGLMWDDDSVDVVINSVAGANKAGTPTSALTVKSDTGNVGIGTTGPGKTLEAYHADSQQILRLTRGSTSFDLGVNASGAQYGFGVWTSGGTSLLNVGTNGGVSIGTGAGYASIAVGKYPPENGLIVEGNIGIGTANPCSKCKVDVHGNMHVKGSLSVNNKDAPKFSYLTPSKNGKIAYASSAGYDIAELFPAQEAVLAGDVLAVGKKGLLRKATRDDTAIIGVVSSAPAILFEGSDLKIGAQSLSFTKGSRPPVALAGRVHVKVSSEYGIIQPGDFLGMSSMQGVAAKAGPGSARIGIALEEYSGKDTGFITMFVGGVQSFDFEETARLLLDRIETLEKKLQSQ